MPEEVGAQGDGDTGTPGRPGVGVRLTSLGLIVLTVLCGITLVLGFVNKDRCTGPQFDKWGRSQPDFDERRYRDVCYSDIQTLWIGRDIDRHVFPYVHGKLTDDGQPVGGVVEYPVLTGVFIWASALFAHTDADFLLYSALLLAPFGLATAWLLGRMSGWRALLWAIGTPLILYAFHNWELPVVLCATAAFYVVHHGWGSRGAERPLLTRATVAAVLLGLGFAFKVYPAIFALPLMLYVLTGGRDGAEFGGRRGPDWRGALRVAGVALGTAVAVNVPFMVAGFEGWRASFTFQLLRKADITTNSIWFWGFRPDSDPDNVPVQELIGVLSPLLMLLSFVAACAVGWVRYQKEGTYPWVPVSAAMLCGFLLLHKVHSPQYTLWLIPMFVLLRVRWGWIVAYLAADLAMGIGIFRWYYEIFYGKHGGIFDGLSAQAVMVGVWGRAALLIGLFFAFLTTRETFRDRLTV
ncbi:glycosyltransferase family 87 protein [Actinophytocola oryzae]|uniref:Putative membrane protein n=1 Tax=Actinophytocola oryzae TaxID=502181 RepID=A0A4R7VME8_9PSEU|nr:putative membrane protein [Actinophytocola oryzae]